MTYFTARKLARLCLIALVLTAAAPALAVPPPKGVLGFRWDDTVQSVATQARTLGLSQISETKRLTEVSTVKYSGLVFDMEAEVHACFYKERLFDITIQFPQAVEDDFFLLRSAIEDHYGGAKTYRGSIGNFGAQANLWKIDDTGIALIMTGQRGIKLEYTDMIKMNKAMEEWRRQTERRREEIRKQL